MPRPGVAKIVDGPGVMFVAAALEEEEGVLKEDGLADNVAAAFFAFVTGCQAEEDEGRPPDDDDDDDDDDPPKRASRFEDASFL